MFRMRIVRCSFPFLVGLFGITAPVVFGQGTTGLFGLATTYGSGGVNPLSMAVADVNLDGKPDMVVLNCGNSSCTGPTVGNIGVLLGNGDGAFGAAKVFSAGGYNEPFSLKIADVNGDGKPDLIVANSCADSTCSVGGVSVLLGKGDGTFEPPVTYAAGGYETAAVAVADLNGDGKPDLVTADFCYVKCSQDGAVGVLFGHGDGTFQSPTTYVLTAPAEDVAVTDFNGDGKLDIVVATACGASSCETTGADILLGNGDGTYQSPVTYTTGGYDFAAIAAVDVNGDGKPDLVVSSACTSSSNCVNGGVTVLLGNEDGTFGAPTTYSAGYTNGGFGGRSLAVKDLNGDGKPDVIVPSFCLDSSCKTGGGVTVLLGNGDGTLQAAVTYPSGGYGAFIGVAAADLNGDGKPDLAIADTCINSGAACTGGVGVLLNTGNAGGSNWTHTWGGGSTDSIVATSRDTNGNLYSAGSTSSFGAGGQDALVLKYDPTGNLLWTKTWGGSSDDYANGVAVDPNGNVYVTGGTSSFGAGWYDLFLLKFDPSGNLLWSETWGGSSYDEGHDISFDSSGNVLVAAEAYSYNPSGTGSSSAVILKFSPDGTLLWNRAWGAQIPGGPTYDGGYSLAIDGNGNTFLTGITWDYNVSPNHDSIFVVKFDGSGNFLWNRNWSGAAEDEAWGTKIVRADPAGNVYIAGRTASQCTSTNFGTCDFDVSILKLDSSGDFVWSKTWRAGAGYDTAISFDFDPSGNLVVTGAKDEFGATAALTCPPFLVQS